MKNNSFFRFIVVIGLLVGLSSCSKEEIPAPGEKTDFPEYDHGQLFFYRLELCDDGPTRVTFDGIFIEEYTHAYLDEYRNCNDHNQPLAGQIIYRKPGVYSFSAVTRGGEHVWTTDVQILQGQCRTLALECDGIVSGNAIYTPVGTVTFWVEQITCGNESDVVVEISGTSGNYSETISPVLESSIDCSNSFNQGYRLDLPVGNYVGHAFEIEGEERTWDFNIDIAEDQCRTFKLWCN